MLQGEGEYNLNSLKEIKITNSFTELDKEVKMCQNYKSNDTYDSCTTRYFMDQMMQKCECLPYEIINAKLNNEKVCGKYTETMSYIFTLSKILTCSSKKQITCLETTIQESTPTECLW